MSKCRIRRTDNKPYLKIERGDDDFYWTDKAKADTWRTYQEAKEAGEAVLFNFPAELWEIICESEDDGPDPESEHEYVIDFRKLKKAIKNKDQDKQKEEEDKIKKIYEDGLLGQILLKINREVLGERMRKREEGHT